MDTASIDIFYYIRNAILCLGFLIGIGAGVFLIIRKRTLAGILAIVGFFLFGLEPIADFVLFRILYRQEFPQEFFQILDYIYPIVTIIAFFLGSIALVIALLNTALSNRSSTSDYPKASGSE